MRPFFQKINEVLEAPEGLHRRAIRDETRLDMVLKHLNQTLHDQNGILPRYRIFVVSASLLASIGVQHRGSDDEVPPLDPQELTGECAPGQTDGDEIFKKVQAALHARHLPDAKIKQIMSVLEGTLVSNNLNTKETDGMTAVAKIYSEIYDELRPTYLTADIADFTGRLFNVMNSWVDVPDGGANDVVLTPRYITDLMARICAVDMNSYVWDWALGSGGFLISAMQLMLRDAHAQLKNDPEAYQRKISEIKTSQLLGVELLPDIYMLAVLNMILVGDGSTNIVNADAINGYDGTYAYDKSKKFKANVFLLNPPYSAEGNGLIFVQKAFEQMSLGMGAVIIQDSAGAGRAMAISQRILKHNRLVASIRMPNDLFKASVQTSIYVFKVGEPHQANDQVRFVDFSNDGYLRTHRKKAISNLRDVDHAHERYQELVGIIQGKVAEPEYYPLGETYFIDTINPSAGNDWNYAQHKKNVAVPKTSDFKSAVYEHLAWEVASALKSQAKPTAAIQSTDEQLQQLARTFQVARQEFKIEELFEKVPTKKLSYKAQDLKGKHDDVYCLPALTAGIENQGLAYYVPR